MHTSIFYTTDVAGGYSPSILDAQRMAVHASHALAVTKETEYQPIDYKEAFRLATLGGSKGRLGASSFTCSRSHQGDRLSANRLQGSIQTGYIWWE